MKYALRFVWYVLRIVIITASAFAILVVAFFVAMDSANVYVVVTDGMKVRAESILMPKDDQNLTKYFTEKFLESQTSALSDPYKDFTIEDIDYKVSVESLWCNPWKNQATATVVESIPKMSYASSLEVPEGKPAPVAPPWQRVRYKITCIKLDDVWRINSLEELEALPAEPTPSPEPSSYISASPLPTATPSPTPKTTASPSPSPTAKK